MATNGARLLKRVTLQYCQHGGSSQGMRMFIASDLKKQFEAENPHVEIETKRVNGKHPIIVADYGDNAHRNSRLMPIDVKNKELEDIMNFMNYVNDRRPGVHRTWAERDRHRTETPSTQGFWHPDDWFDAYKIKDE